MPPNFTLDDIRFGTDRGTFERAVAIYEGGKVTRFRRDEYGCSALVLGGSPYKVTVSLRHYDHATCTCYLGEQSDVLCKHMVAVALRAVLGGRPLTEAEKKYHDAPSSSGRAGVLPKAELAETKRIITAALRYIKPYDGPSRVWFQYQNSLSEGTNRLSKIISELPVCREAAKLVVDLLLRLDRKLAESGVDDSDGTVGDFIEGTVRVLTEYAALDPECIKEFERLKNQKTCFEWEGPLTALCGK